MPEQPPEALKKQRSLLIESFVLAVAVLLLGAAAHLWYLIANCPLDLAGDEAHYWEWSRRLDLSYYSKGPLVAYIIAVGRALWTDWSVRLVGSEMLAVRLPAVILAVLTGIGIFTLLTSTLRNPRLALAAVALTFTVPILAAGSMLMTIDAPLMCAWTWGLVCVHRALHRDKWIWWLLTGLLIAVGILAKYTMVLIFPVVGLTILLRPEYRRFVKRPEPYVATLLGLAAGLAPIAIWNANHDWVSFRHVAGQAGVSSKTAFDITGPFAYIVGQAAVVNPVWFIALIWAAIEVWRRPKDNAEPHEAADMWLILLATIVPAAFFLLFSPITIVQPNWPVLSLVGGCGVLVFWLGRGLRAVEPKLRTRSQSLIVAGVLVGGSMVAVGHHSQWLTPLFARMTRGAPSWDLTPIAKYDPTARLRGWSQLGAAVGEVLAAHATGAEQPFILADDYTVASEIAFYCPQHPQVYCAQSVLGDRRSQYDLWTNPIDNAEQFLGRPCIYIGKLHRAISDREDLTKGALPHLERLQIVEYKLDGHPLQIWTMYWGPAFAGFATDAARCDGAY